MHAKNDYPWFSDGVEAGFGRSSSPSSCVSQANVSGIKSTAHHPVDNDHSPPPATRSEAGKKLIRSKSRPPLQELQARVLEAQLKAAESQTAAAEAQLKAANAQIAASLAVEKAASNLSECLRNHVNVCAPFLSTQLQRVELDVAESVMNLHEDSRNGPEYSFTSL